MHRSTRFLVSSKISSRRRAQTCCKTIPPRFVSSRWTVADASISSLCRGLVIVNIHAPLVSRERSTLISPRYPLSSPPTAPSEADIWPSTLAPLSSEVTSMSSRIDSLEAAISDILNNSIADYPSHPPPVAETSKTEESQD
jgi:hypothetical protein